jgi:hypothetical protein
MTERFIIGIGSQRAGTTLLHSLLSDTSNAFMHPVKELHYFDTLYGIRDPSALREFSMRQLKREVNRIVSNSDLAFASKRRYKCMLRTTMLLASTPLANIEYRDLFRPFLSRKQPLGEITPEYMLLNEDQATQLRNVVGEDATIILLRRDPIDRLLSAAKLFNVYNNLNMDQNELAAWLNRMLDEESSWIQAQDKYNDYKRATRIFGMLFPRFIAIDYEELVCKPKDVAKRISELAEIQIDSDSFAEGSVNRKNSLGEQELTSPALSGRLRERYKEYEDNNDRRALCSPAM